MTKRLKWPHITCILAVGLAASSAIFGNWGEAVAWSVAAMGWASSDHYEREARR